MGKEQFSMVSTFTHVNATTASPSFVTSAITQDIRLEVKTVMVVLAEKNGILTASVFRDSAKVRGCYSRDVYVWRGRCWQHRGKDRKKYGTPPFPPLGANHIVIESVDIYTLKPLTAEQKERLCSVITVLPQTER